MLNTTSPGLIRPLLENPLICRLPHLLLAHPAAGLFQFDFSTVTICGFNMKTLAYPLPMQRVALLPPYPLWGGIDTLDVGGILLPSIFLPIC